ncbi:hypothetical protein ACEUZ9_001066 [Paracoccus litorisediminis]|uniref:hypothetical protein n=1 Tax=Paracoccus litorisediminis TaxID=2006130 RepID=UPI003733E186
MLATQVTETTTPDASEAKRLVKLWLLMLGDEPICLSDIEFLLRRMPHDEAVSILHRFSKGEDALLRRCLVVYPDQDSEFMIEGETLEDALISGEVKNPTDDALLRLSEYPTRFIFYAAKMHLNMH